MKELQNYSSVENLTGLLQILEKQEQQTSLMEELLKENEMLNSTIIRLQDNISDLEKKLKESKITIQEKEEELDELSELNNSLNNENSKLHSQITTLEKQLSELTKLTDRQQKQINELVSLKE